MKKIIALTLMTSLLIGTAKAEDVCEDRFESDLIQIAQQSSSACLGTSIQDVQGHMGINERIAKNRLIALNFSLEQNKTLKKKATVYAALRTGALSIALAVPVIYGGWAAGISGIAAGTSDALLGAYVTIGLISYKEFMLVPQQSGFLDQIKKNANVSAENLISSFDKDAMAFKDAQAKINEVKTEFQNKTTEGKTLSWEDVRYLNIQVQADEAKKKLYEMELEYYQAVRAYLNDYCKNI